MRGYLKRGRQDREPSDGGRSDLDRWIRSEGSRDRRCSESATGDAKGDPIQNTGYRFHHKIAGVELPGLGVRLPGDIWRL